MKLSNLHIVLIISALAVLLGCEREPVPGKDVRISWDVSLNSPATKVYPANTAPYSTTNTFGSYAFLYYGSSASDWATADYSVYINGLQVRYFGIGTPMWSTLTEYYWPTTTNSWLHFASFSPYNTLHGKASYGSKADGIIIPNYVIPANKEDQHFLTTGGETLYDDDLMVSNEYDVSCPSMESSDIGPTYEFTGVPTLFSHIMTRININVLQDTTFIVPYYDDQTISIRKIKLINIYNKGNFKSLPTPTWSGHSATADTAVLYSSNVGTDAIAKTATPPPANPDTTSVVTNYLAMPQTIEDGLQEIEITYRITSTLSGYIFTEDVVESGYLYAANRNWTSNTDITYTIKLFAIKEHPIEFTATAQSWISNISASNEVPGQNFHITPED
ncbi:MAG: hypothetical protein J5759_04005 [Bacteroidales bacterium]|nr:hypothetical protein [Bacteroidales bacterium]